MKLAEYCDEFLIHAVDVEGKANGIEEGIASLIGQTEGIKVTYAGGISSFHDLDRLKELGHGKIDFTVGSALELFGGSMPFLTWQHITDVRSWSEALTWLLSCRRLH